MNRKQQLVLMIFLLAGISLWAQTKDKNAKPKVKTIPVYLGRSNSVSDGSNITKRVFDSLLRQGLTSRDSAGRNYKVEGFAFTYGERNLYEDSVGNLMWVTDHLTEYCYGDTLSTFLIGNITGRSKGGDTVYFDQLTVRSPEGKGEIGRSIRVVLSK